MTDFNKELNAKAYGLVAGNITLDEFTSWYKLAVAASAPTIKSEPEPESVPFTPPPVKLSSFKDYPHEEPDEAMREHHRKLLGSGSED